MTFSDPLNSQCFSTFHNQISHTRRHASKFLRYFGRMQNADHEKNKNESLSNVPAQWKTITRFNHTHTHTHIIHARRTRRNTILTSKSGDKQIDKPTNKNKSSENLFAGRNRDNVSTHNKKQTANTNKIIRNRQQYNWTHCKSEKSTMKKKLRAEKVIEML